MLHKKHSSDDIESELEKIDQCEAHFIEKEIKKSVKAEQKAIAKELLEAEEAKRDASMIHDMDPVDKMVLAIWKRAEDDIREFADVIKFGRTVEKSKLAMMQKEFYASIKFFRNEQGYSLGALSTVANLPLNNSKLQKKIQDILALADETIAMMNNLQREAEIEVAPQYRMGLSL